MESKSDIAIKFGLSPLADLIWQQDVLKKPLESLASEYLREGSQFATMDGVVNGVRHILVGKILADQNLWQGLRDLCHKNNSAKVNDDFLQDFMNKKIIHTLDGVIRFQLETAISDAYHFVIKSVLIKELAHSTRRVGNQNPVTVKQPFKRSKLPKLPQRRAVFGTLADQFKGITKNREKI